MNRSTTTTSAAASRGTGLRRRDWLLGTGAVLAGPALATHGWKPYEGVPPLYLQGEVTMIIWAEPHPHLEVVQHVGAPLPPDLAQRTVPRQKDPVDMKQLLAQARLPVGEDRIWRVELAPLPRLLAWNVPRPKIQDVIGVVGHAGPPVTGSPTILAEILFIGDRAYPLRSDPA